LINNRPIPIIRDHNHNKLAELHEAYNIKVIKRFGELNELEFMIPKYEQDVYGQTKYDESGNSIPNPKWQYIQNEFVIEYDGNYYVIKNHRDIRDENNNIISNVQAKDMAIELTYKYVQFLDLTPPTSNPVRADTAITQVLTTGNTDWTLGTVDSSLLQDEGVDIKRTFKFEWNTVLESLYKITEKFGGYLNFDISWDSNLNQWDKKINLILPNSYNGIQFRYNKNIKNIEKESNSNEIYTRMWVYGKDNLSIHEIGTETRTDNNITYNAHEYGQSYIDNFQYFLGLGYSYQECLDKFIYDYRFKDDTYVKDDSIDMTQELYDDAKKKLEELSIPKLTYRLSVHDLSVLTGFEYESFNVGDTVNIIDEDLNVNITATIMSIDKTDNEPHLATVEISNYSNSLGNVFKKVINSTKSYAYEKTKELESYTTQITDDLQNQIDNKITTYYQDTMPHSEYINIPDNAEYNKYIGDLWYDTTSTEKKTYRYTKNQNGANFDYIWEELEISKEIFDTIDGKRTVYTSQPTSYKARDLLIPNTPFTVGVKTFNAQEIYIATTDNTSFNENDWILAVKYTDDTRAIEAENNAKNYTDNTAVLKDVDYNNVQINPIDGVKVSHTDGSTSKINGDGVEVRGGNVTIYDENNRLVMDGRGVNPLETSGWGVTTGLTFEVQSITDKNYIDIYTTQDINAQAAGFYIYLNDVSQLGSSGTIYLNAPNNSGKREYFDYDLVDVANNRIRSTSDCDSFIPSGSQGIVKVIDGVTQPDPSATVNLLIKKGSCILKNGKYVKFTNDVIYQLPISSTWSDWDSWEYRVIFVNSSGNITHVSAGTAGAVKDSQNINNYPEHPRYNAMGNGTPDDNCVVLGAVLCGFGEGYMGAFVFMHPDFRDERALKVTDEIFNLPQYYSGDDSVEKSVLATSTVSYGSWVATGIYLTSGQEYEIAIPIGQGKRLAIVSISGGSYEYSQDDSTKGAVIMVGLKDPYTNAWQPRVSIGYNNYFIDNYYSDGYGQYIVSNSSLGWSYRRIKDSYLQIGADGEVYLHITLHQYSSSETRDIRISWYAM
jgi:phage minor structural protein